MKKYLILIAGSPATGKSYLINKIRTAISDILVITPDELKEMCADSVGFNTLEEKAALEKEVWKFYYDILKLYMQVGKKVILSEYPFSYKQANKLAELADYFKYEIITIRLVADFDILWERRKKRDIEPSRHLSHIMRKYHYGDELQDRTMADNLITREEFYKIITERAYDKFKLGELIEFDVSDYSLVNYDSYIQSLKRRIELDM